MFCFVGGHFLDLPRRNQCHLFGVDSAAPHKKSISHKSRAKPFHPPPPTSNCHPLLPPFITHPKETLISDSQDGF